MLFLFRRMMRSIFRTGQVRIIEPDGKACNYGDGAGDPVIVRIHDRPTIARLLIHSDLYLGEAYVNGTLTMEQGAIFDLLALATDNLVKNDPIAALEGLRRLRNLVRRLEEYNPVGRAIKNVAHHYDLSGELYDLFLDRDRQYSCAYFEVPWFAIG